MNKSKVLTPDVIEKIDAAIDAFRKIDAANAEERASIDARVAVLEWIKSGKSGTVQVHGPKNDD